MCLKEAPTVRTGTGARKWAVPPGRADHIAQACSSSGDGGQAKVLLNHEREGAAQPRLGRRVGWQDAGRDVREGPFLHLGKNDRAEAVPGSGDFPDHHDHFGREPGYEAGKAKPQETGQTRSRSGSKGPTSVVRPRCG